MSITIREDVMDSLTSLLFYFCVSLNNVVFFLLHIPAIKKVPIFAESCLAVDLEQSSNVSDQKIKFSCIMRVTSMLY